MSTQLWHADIYLPPNVTLPTGQLSLYYPSHARERCEARGIRTFKSVSLRRFRLIEVETLNGQPIKYVIRGQYDSVNDIVIVYTPRDGRGYVKTAWLNSTIDNHATLDRSLYEPAP